ncbi:MAG: FAD/NAD(P)-binding protein [Holophagales bacterium]|nr:FAD/NAD(P)-binding protein [Holophagales bacterium]
MGSDLHARALGKVPIAAAPRPADAKVVDRFASRPFRVTAKKLETADTWTLRLTPVDGDDLPFEAGQFTMVSVFGVGEAPISISGDPASPSVLVHTARAVGAVTRAITAARRGDVLGIRGPYGSRWPVEQAEGCDLVVIAGGIGLAPLRPAIHQILSRRRRYGRVILLYGARTPQDLLYRKELETWRGRFDLNVEVTVDAAGRDWFGHVGVVTKLIPPAFDRHHTLAMVCGPEIMMRFSAQALLGRGLPPERIHVSLERNFHCGVGMCGHCQVGPFFVCKDGPVFPYSRIDTAFKIREL